MKLGAPKRLKKDGLFIGSARKEVFDRLKILSRLDRYSHSHERRASTIWAQGLIIRRLDACYFKDKQTNPAEHLVICINRLTLQRTGRSSQEVPRHDIGRVLTQILPQMRLIYSQNWPRSSHVPISNVRYLPKPSLMVSVAFGMFFLTLCLAKSPDGELQTHSRFFTSGASKAELEDRISVLEINLEACAVAYKVEIRQKVRSVEDCTTKHEDHNLCFPEVSALPNQLQDSELDTPRLWKIFKAQTAKNECPLAVATVVQPKTPFSYNADGDLISVFTITGS